MLSTSTGITIPRLTFQSFQLFKDFFYWHNHFSTNPATISSILNHLAKECWRKWGENMALECNLSSWIQTIFRLRNSFYSSFCLPRFRVKNFKHNPAFVPVGTSVRSARQMKFFSFGNNFPKKLSNRLPWLKSVAEIPILRQKKPLAMGEQGMLIVRSASEDVWQKRASLLSRKPTKLVSFFFDVPGLNEAA